MKGSRFAVLRATRTYGVCTPTRAALQTPDRRRYPLTRLTEQRS
ncbi:hypothetical protein P3T23_001497 [Paraburkholderia sp. GAS448]